MTSLEWALQFVKYKIKEMVRANVYGRASIDVYSQIFCRRKTEHYGDPLFLRLAQGDA